MFKRNRRAYRIFFATDIHGSDRLFRKFLAAATVYEADALILGGDIVGKAIVPIARVASDRYEATFQERHETCSADGLSELTARINFNGLYPWVADERDVVRLRSDQEFGAQIFHQLMVDQVAGWCRLAAERLNGDTECVITPGISTFPSGSFTPGHSLRSCSPAIRPFRSLACPQPRARPGAKTVSGA